MYRLLGALVYPASFVLDFDVLARVPILRA
jgi:hypothetical protein